MSTLVLIIIVFILTFSFTAFTGAPYVPSKKADLHKAFTILYPLNSTDLLIDLGAGDGKVIALARQYGASALGLELNPTLVLIANLRLKLARRSASSLDHSVSTSRSRSVSRHSHSTSNIVPVARVRCANLFTFDFPPETTVVYVFGDSRDILKIYQRIQNQADRLRKPLYLISLAFDIPQQKPLKKVSPYYLYKITPSSSNHRNSP